MKVFSLTASSGNADTAATAKLAINKTIHATLTKHNNLPFNFLTLKNRVLISKFKVCLFTVIQQKEKVEITAFVFKTISCTRSLQLPTQNSLNRIYHPKIAVNES
jgi:hypothetical protein